MLNVVSAAEGGGEPNNTTNMAISPPEHSAENESGELLDYNDASVLEQFHEDALRQVMRHIVIFMLKGHHSLLQHHLARQIIGNFK